VAGIVLVAGVALRGGLAGREPHQPAPHAGARALAPVSEAGDELQRLLGTRAEIRYVDGLRQPVTFGASARSSCCRRRSASTRKTSSARWSATS
jgi:hypothetical protein